MTDDRRRLPQVMDPNVVMAGNFRLNNGHGWVAHAPGASEIELNGCFSAAELRRFVEILEGRRG